MKVIRVARHTVGDPLRGGHLLQGDEKISSAEAPEQRCKVTPLAHSLRGLNASLPTKVCYIVVHLAVPTQSRSSSGSWAASMDCISSSQDKTSNADVKSREICRPPWFSFGLGLASNASMILRAGAEQAS